MQVRSRLPGADLHQGTWKVCWIRVSVPRPVVATTILDELGSRFCRINCRCPKGRPVFTDLFASQSQTPFPERFELRSAAVESRLWGTFTRSRRLG
jgi:hypothetical protein